MNTGSERRLSRRRFLASTSALGAASLIGLSNTAAAEPPPETTRIRLVHLPAICTAPQYIAEELLHLEGFSEVEYVELKVNTTALVIESGEADIAMEAAPSVVTALDTGRNNIALAGIHAGCYELFGNNRVQSIQDLKGKRVSISGFHSLEHVFLSSIVAYLGMDPGKDIQWVVAETVGAAMQMFADGKVDAFLGFAPLPHELREKKVGHLILNTLQDRPWSQYFCCMATANREFVTKRPVATKRALRALLKAADICADDPERAARFLAAKGYEPRYGVALEILKSLPYRRWRESQPEDTLRFHALRLHEVGIIKSSPQKIIAQGTDWRFLNELMKELTVRPERVDSLQ
jgi:NitT/TauT family transport system substrate-binding protein